MIRVWAIAGIGIVLAGAVWAAEADQFLTWDLELRDSAPALNRYLNENLQVCLDRVNKRTRPVTDPRELTETVYLFFFQGLHSSRVRAFLHYSDDIDRYPPLEVSSREYQRRSILRGFAFPYILPMARTIRIGDVYLSVDKISHFFGFGRRYYQRYCRHRDEGMSDEEAMERVVKWGIHNEESMVGKLVDGIFSHGDMEANFSGFLMARDLCGGDNPNIVYAEGEWRIARPVDIGKYVTPGFDESYNTSHYWAMRERIVLPILKEEYCAKRSLPMVQARFKRYGDWPPSFSQRVITRYYDAKGKNPQREQSLETICEECAVAGPPALVGTAAK